MNNKEYTFTEVMNKLDKTMESLGRTYGACGDVDCEECPLHLKNNVYAEHLCFNRVIETPECRNKFVDVIMNYTPKVDWSRVKTDTKIEVSNDGRRWKNAYFAEYRNGTVYAWYEGKTSFTACTMTQECKYAKLYEK